MLEKILFLIFTNFMLTETNTLNNLTQCENVIIDDTFLKNIKSDEDFKFFQKSILLQRNYECLNREYFNLDELKTHERNIISSNSNLVSVLNITCFDYDRLRVYFDSLNKSKEHRHLSLINVLLNQMFNKGCNLCSDNEQVESPDKQLKMWIYALLAATAITLSSFAGAFLIPLTKHKYYKRILMFLISIAIGTLCGTGFLHLIPQAYGISEDPNYNYNHMYAWKSLVMIAGLYLFFIVEQILRFLIQFRKHKKIEKEKSKKNLVELQPINHHLIEEEEERNRYGYIYHMEDDALSQKLNKTPIGSIAMKINKAHLNHSELAHTIAPVAWIIIIGEGLHNFIDGLSIGAAFTDSILNGLSLSLAIICEEFPHKLGDFAILLAAGMPLKVALFCNFLSSCLIYVGLAIGIFVGENLNANMWIYAIAAGMFIYIGVCDMIPELGEMANEIEKEQIEEDSKKQHFGKGHKEKFAVKIKIVNILIQNIGMLIGFGCMLSLAIYAKKIQL
ncbi:unnamed protein product [Brachionus calyciflorus]|uniref:Uncharacterized protein n=1 Tax=Brachionus calyciflorus TaxID=104777 RepID=A0A813RN09_9BILA|nr:unnamed protein product [Brachionus calyciflorus]